MPRITITGDGQNTTVTIDPGETLLKALRKAGAGIAIPCGGSRRCGKCLVRVTGDLPPAEMPEATLLEGRPPGSRLACCARVRGDCSVVLPDQREAVIETAYTPWQGPLDPLYAAGYGAAFDIGTTTVAGQLFSRNEKKPLLAAGELNAQQPYGADVLSRVVYCNEHTVNTLRDLIRTQLSAMTKGLCSGAGVAVKELSYMVVTGNSIMLYILCGIEPRPLGMVPFTMSTRFDGEYDLGLEGLPGLKVYLPGSPSAYIGADISCSVLASGITKAGGNILLIDAGTNGEIVLSSAGGLTCCSTAAGPAFEGADISCGGNASPGAIDSVDYREGAFRYTTIGGGPGVKLCGSGLIDAAAALLDADIINAKGTFGTEHKGRALIGDTAVYVTQRDIRQLQMAKAAIRAGMDTLLYECGIGYAELDAIVLCGGFGSYMRPKSAERIGLLPPGCAEKTRAIGNAAGNGAAQILQSRQKQQEARAIARHMDTIELATNRFFLQRFLKTMAFTGPENTPGSLSR
ncbi:MAG: ASKHA domain-containing protein [Spirochaetaceae bacterium]|jgi:uncharacterized 2Fe-2S/4Fe-4S cluster protein (DUF4445 family)|nr:ASKHA domain-containing protein [Spirochaetaceae bacterium]